MKAIGIGVLGWLCMQNFLLNAQAAQAAQTRVEPNVVYGMVSGLALLMDVYRPEEPNGRGILFVWGSGWHASPAYGAGPLKQRGPFPALTDAGYTVFVINHRAAPRFRFPAAVRDAQRAVRFIRHHAGRFGIDARRLGGIGGSSGGHLVCMLGVLDGTGDPEARDPVERESARVQAVVAFAAATDLASLQSEKGSPFAQSFLGMPPSRVGASNPVADERYREASPNLHVTADDAPFLLIHGDADETVPFQQAEVMEQALRQGGVPVELVRVPGGSHGVLPIMVQRGWVETAEGRYEDEAMIGWLDRHLIARETP